MHFPLETLCFSLLLLLLPLDVACLPFVACHLRLFSSRENISRLIEFIACTNSLMCIFYEFITGSSECIHGYILAL